MILSNSLTNACAVALLSLATPLPAYAFWPFTSDAEAFAQACEDVLTPRLKSPSSYSRIKISEILRDAGDDADFAGPDPALTGMADEPSVMAAYQKMKDLFKDGAYERLQIVIEYEASNSFGAAIGDRALCSEYVPVGATWASQSYHSIRANGYSAAEWAIARVAANLAGN